MSSSTERKIGSPCRPTAVQGASRTREAARLDGKMDVPGGPVGGGKLLRMGFHLRAIRISDAAVIARLIADPRFSYPLLTGGMGFRVGWWLRLGRALNYSVKCYLGHRWGGLLFGRQVHWIMAIVTQPGRFVGIVMIDEVLRPGPSGSRLFPALRMLKHSERRLRLEAGDGELGFFLDPEFQRRGLALAAVEDLCRRVSSLRGADGEPILKRVWAETGRDNLAARRLLERMGLALAAQPPSAMPRRRGRDGASVDLLHYGQPPFPVPALLERCEAIWVTHESSTTG